MITISPSGHLFECRTTHRAIALAPSECLRPVDLAHPGGQRIPFGVGRHVRGMMGVVLMLGPLTPGGLRLATTVGSGADACFGLRDLTCAQAITDSDTLNRIADVGNWLDDLADDTLERRLDQAKMDSGFKLVAEEFRNGLVGPTEDDLLRHRKAWTRLAAWT